MSTFRRRDMDSRDRFEYFLVRRMDTKDIGEEPMDEARVKDLMKVCGQYDRGLVTAEEACEKILWGCIEPHLVAKYADLIPESLKSAFPAVLAALPVSDEGWLVARPPFAQFDGTVESWARSIVEYRVNTEAIRECLLGEKSVPAAPDFEDRVRAARRASLGIASE